MGYVTATCWTGDDFENDHPGTFFFFGVVKPHAALFTILFGLEYIQCSVLSIAIPIVFFLSVQYDIYWTCDSKMKFENKNRYYFIKL